MSTEKLYVHIHVWQLQDIAVQMLPVKLSVFSLLDIESRPRPYCIKVGGFYLVNKRNIFQCICHIYSEAISNDYITGHSQYILLPGTNNAVPCIRFFFFSVAEYNRILLWI